MKIKPCPFCKCSGDDSYTRVIDKEDGYGARVCGMCEASGPMIVSDNDPDEPPWRDEATRRWNLRSGTTVRYDERNNDRRCVVCNKKMDKALDPMRHEGYGYCGIDCKNEGIGEKA